MTEKVYALWDQRPFRLAFAALAAVVLVVGAIAFVRSREGHPVTYAGGSGPITDNATAQYGKRIPLPPEAQSVAKRFVADGVLRKDPLAARALVSATLRNVVSKAEWAAGTMPVPQFPVKDFAGAGFKVLRSRQRDVLMDISIGSTVPSAVKGFDMFVELRPVNGHWLVVSAAPRDSVPIPAAN